MKQLKYVCLNKCVNCVKKTTLLNSITCMCHCVNYDSHFGILKFVSRLLMQLNHYILTAGFSLYFILKISGSIEDREYWFISKGQYSRTLRPTYGSIPTDVFLLCFSCIWGSRPFYSNKQLQNVPTKTHSTLYREADFKARLSATRNLAPFLSKWFILYSVSLFNLL